MGSPDRLSEGLQRRVITGDPSSFNSSDRKGGFTPEGDGSLRSSQQGTGLGTLGRRCWVRSQMCDLGVWEGDLRLGTEGRGR